MVPPRAEIICVKTCNQWGALLLATVLPDVVPERRKSMRSSLWIVTIVLFILLGMFNPCVAKQPGLLFAHRGGASEFEENSLSAFQACYDQGLRGFETDVRMTKDGEFVLLHDENLERTHDASGPVEDKTSAELRNVKSDASGQPLTFFSDLLNYLADKPGVYLELEMKTRNHDHYPDKRLHEYCERLHKLVQDRRPEGSEYVLTSFDKRPLNYINKLDPQADLLYIVNDGTCSPTSVEAAKEIGVKRIGVRIDKVTRSEVRAAQQAGLRVSCWPGQTLQDYHLAVGLGVDAICSDVPVAVQTWKSVHER